MHPRTCATLAMCTALTWATALQTPTALAEDHPLQAPSLGVGPHPYEQRVSMAGPVAETVSGGVLVVMAPVLTGIVALTTGPSWVECWGPEDPQCDGKLQEKQRHADAVGIAVGVPVGLVGVVLLAHGAYRIKRVRATRRDARRPSAWNLEAGPQRASIMARWSS